MLVLTRNANQSIMIGHDVVVTVLEIRGDQVRLGIRAPRSIDVHREEVYAALQRANRSAATSTEKTLSALGGLPKPPGAKPEQAPSTDAGADSGDDSPGFVRVMHSAPEVSIKEAALGVAMGAPLIDVREPTEFEMMRVPQAQLMPLGEVLERINELDQTERIYVICATGVRSMSVAGALRQAGFDAVSVAGGTIGWEADGRQVVHGDSTDS